MNIALTYGIGSAAESNLISASWDSTNRELILTTDPTKETFVYALLFTNNTTTVPTPSLTTLDSSSFFYTQGIMEAGGATYHSISESVIVGTTTGYKFVISSSAAGNFSHLRWNVYVYSRS